MLHEEGDEKVALSVMRGDDFSSADWLILEGDGYHTSEQALAAGKIWRELLSVSFARVAIGADFDPLPRAQRNGNDLPEDQNAPGLIVFPRQPGLTGRIETWAPLLVVGPTLQSFVDNHLPAVRHALPEGLTQRPELDLAFRLVHLALINSYAEAKYILFVTAVEALIPDSRPARDDEAFVTALNTLMVYAKEPSRFPQAIREGVLSMLANMRKESITSLGAKLAAKLDGTYNGLSPEDYFDRVYSTRSKLVHGLLDRGARPDIGEIARGIDILHQFVLDLLNYAVENPIEE